MKSAVPFTDSYHNSYWCDTRAPQISLCHPHFLEVINHVYYNAATSTNEEDLSYYVRKLEFLQSNGYFAEEKPVFDFSITEDQIRYQIANSPQVVFEVTDACNLRCQYCFYSDLYGNHDARENKVMKKEDVLPFLDYLCELWDSSFNISPNKFIFIGFFGGEPLLNMKFIIQIVELIRGRKDAHRFKFNMTTNGILLDKYIDSLVKYDFRLLVSLDGSETNNRYRLDKNGGSSFLKVHHNILYIKEHYPEYYERNVSINSVLHDANSVEEVYKYMKSTYGKIPSLAEMNEVGVLEERIADYNKMYRNENASVNSSEIQSEIEKELFANLNRYMDAALLIHCYSGFVYKRYSELLRKTEYSRVPSGTCLPFSKKIFVTVNGKILPCETVPQQYYLASVDKDKLDIDFKRIASFYNTHFDKLRKLCGTCYHYKTCKQCLFKFGSLEKISCENYWSVNDLKRFFSVFFTFLCDHPGDYNRIMEELVIQ